MHWTTKIEYFAPICTSGIIFSYFYFKFSLPVTIVFMILILLHTWAVILSFQISNIEIFNWIQGIRYRKNHNLKVYNQILYKQIAIVSYHFGIGSLIALSAYSLLQLKQPAAALTILTATYLGSTATILGIGLRMVFNKEL